MDAWFGFWAAVVIMSGLGGISTKTVPFGSPWATFWAVMLIVAWVAMTTALIFREGR